MAMRQFQMAVSVTLLSLMSGCATSSLRTTWDSSVASVSRLTGRDKSVLASDSVRTQLTPEFRNAQRNLNNAESMFLAHARLMEDQGKFAEARQRYREIITGYPKNVDAAVGLARIEQKTGRIEQAEEILNELEEKYPRSVPVRLALGALYSERGRLTQAVDTYTTAAELDPENQTLRYELGIALARVDRFEEALPHLKFAVGESAATYNIGYMMFESGRSEAALRWFNAALDGHPDEQTRLQATEMIARLIPPQDPGTTEHDIRTASATQQDDSQTQSSANRMSQGSPRILPATHSETTQSGASPRQSVFSTASRTIPVSPSQQTAAAPQATISAAGANDVPQWDGGASAQSPTTVTAPVSAGNAGPQDPPMWRSRKR